MRLVAFASRGTEHEQALSYAGLPRRTDHARGPGSSFDHREGYEARRSLPGLRTVRAGPFTAVTGGARPICPCSGVQSASTSTSLFIAGAALRTHAGTSESGLI